MVRYAINREGAADCAWEITPTYAEKLELEKMAAKPCRPVHAGQGLYQVASGERTYAVNIVTRTCGCRKWDITGVPCKHAVSCIYKRKEHPEDYISDFFKKHMYQLAYNYMIYPVPEKSGWTKTDTIDIDPPIFTRHPGRPKKNRRKGIHEVPQPSGNNKMTTTTCSNCNLQGHKYTHCAQPLRPDLEIRRNKHKSNRRIPDYVIAQEEEDVAQEEEYVEQEGLGQQEEYVAQPEKTMEEQLEELVEAAEREVAEKEAQIAAKHAAQVAAQRSAVAAKKAAQKALAAAKRAEQKAKTAALLADQRAQAAAQLTTEECEGAQEQAAERVRFVPAPRGGRGATRGGRGGRTTTTSGRTSATSARGGRTTSARRGRTTSAILQPTPTNMPWHPPGPSTGGGRGMEKMPVTGRGTSRNGRMMGYFTASGNY
uniref:SWIM-type domain-containing protein n=1 Tax=Triticum urartu TaxID=4572 RepID=A0A8R7NY46_TRIUA